MLERHLLAAATAAIAAAAPEAPAPAAAAATAAATAAAAWWLRTGAALLLGGFYSRAHRGGRAGQRFGATSAGSHSVFTKNRPCEPKASLPAVMSSVYTIPGEMVCTPMPVPCRGGAIARGRGAISTFRLLQTALGFRV